MLQDASLQDTVSGKTIFLTAWNTILTHSGIDTPVN